MIVERFTGWAARVSVATQAAEAGREFVGIALGPKSHAGRVLVNGELLQAGHVLPLRARQYAITPVEPAAGLASIDTLEVLLFQCASELPVNVSRANGRFSVAPSANNINAAGWTRVLTLPYQARRRSRIAPFVTTADDLGYQVIGRWFATSTQAVREHTIVSVAAVAGVTAPVFYLPDDEVFDELAIELRCLAGSADAGCDVDVSGDAGR